MICPKCGGAGNDGSLEEMDCPKCDGFGEVGSVERVAFLTMPRLIALLGVVVLMAFGFGKAHADVTQSNSNDILRNSGTAANATSTAGAVSDVSVQANPQAVSSAISGDALSSSTIQSGAVTNSLGPIQAFSGPAESSSEIGDINIKGDSNPRQAPSVGLVAPPSTAPLMKCLGIGGSEERGSTVIGHCWLQRDLYAEHRADRHALAGRYEAATQALCDKRLYRRDFKDRADCEAQTLQSYYDQDAATDQSAHYEQTIRELTAEIAKEQERFNRLEAEVGGGKKPKAPVLLASNDETEELKRIILAQEKSIRRLEKELDESEEDIEDLEDEVDDTEEQFRAWLQAREDKLAPLKRKYADE